MELESFFSLGDHLEKAGQSDNTPRIVSQLVDFEGLRDLLREQLGYGDNPSGLRAPRWWFGDRGGQSDLRDLFPLSLLLLAASAESQEASRPATYPPRRTLSPSRQASTTNTYRLIFL